MPSFLSLQYPNGRTHDMESADELQPGQAFELFGHQWKVVGWAGRAGSRDAGATPRLLCLQTH